VAARGDLWMLTEDGLAELHRAPDDAPGPMTPSQVQAAVDAEWARTLTFPFEPGKTSLVDTLLPDEFDGLVQAGRGRVRAGLERPAA
jgi:hypothetical protein